MSSNRKRGLIVLAAGVVVTLGVVIPTVIAASGGSNGATARAAGLAPATIFTNSGSSCNNSKMTYASNDAVNYTTTSTSYVPVPGMSVTDLPLRASCAEITFSAWPYAAGANVIFVRT